MALAGREAGAAERDALIERDVVADVGGLADHHARAVVDEQALADARRGVDLDARCSARVSIESRRGSSGTPASLQRVRDAVGEQRVDAGPGGEDLRRRDAARGGIALARGEHVAAHLFGDPRERAETAPWQQRSGHADAARPCAG